MEPLLAKPGLSAQEEGRRHALPPRPRLDVDRGEEPEGGLVSRVLAPHDGVSSDATRIELGEEDSSRRARGIEVKANALAQPLQRVEARPSLLAQDVDEGRAHPLGHELDLV